MLEMNATKAKIFTPFNQYSLFVCLSDTSNVLQVGISPWLNAGTFATSSTLAVTNALGRLGPQT
jgi:hypothetical protein